jgi:hypothetical protein
MSSRPRKVWASSDYSQRHWQQRAAFEKRQGDADGFFEHALDWFVYDGEPIKDPYRRGCELARLVAAKRTLFDEPGYTPRRPADRAGLFVAQWNSRCRADRSGNRPLIKCANATVKH